MVYPGMQPTPSKQHSKQHVQTISFTQSALTSIPRLQISLGMDPFKLVSSNEIFSKLVNNPSSEGTVPDKSVKSSANRRSVVNRPNSVGIDPQRLGLRSKPNVSVKKQQKKTLSKTTCRLAKKTQTRCQERTNAGKSSHLRRKGPGKIVPT